MGGGSDGRGGAEVAGPPRRVQRLLAPSDGPRYRQIVLTLGAAGDIGLALHEMGGSPTAPWGFDDLEITARLDPAAATRLTFDTLVGRLNGHADALERLLELCEAHGVIPEIACWT